MEKRTVISSMIFKAVERFTVKGIGFVISVLLARMIAPEIFGQIAIITVFINLSQSIVDGGLSTALVQNKDVTERDYSTVFYICMAVSALICLVIEAAAPFIAGYYDSPELLLPLRVYIFSVFFSAYASILTARMQKELRFKQMMACNLTATCVSGLLGVGAAMAGLGIWALVIYYSANTLAGCAAMYVAVRWRPRLCFDVSRAKVLYGFGWKMLASSMLCSLYYDLRSLIIGKRFSTEALAYYERGFQIPFVITNAIDNSVQAVMFPVLSQAQDEKAVFRGMLRRSVGMSALLLLPATFGLTAVAGTFIPLLLTDKWLPSVPFMEILSASVAAHAFTSPNLVAIKALGRSDVYMKLELVRRLAMLVVLFFTVICFDTVIAMAYTFLFSSWLDAVFCAWPNGKLVGYGVLDQFKDVWKLLAASVIMALAVYALSALALPLLLKLMVQVLAGAGIYAALCALMKEKNFLYALDMLRGFLKRKGA